MCIFLYFHEKNFYNRIKPQIHFECFIHNLQIIFYLSSVFIVIVVASSFSFLFLLSREFYFKKTFFYAGFGFEKEERNCRPIVVVSLENASLIRIARYTKD